MLTGGFYAEVELEYDADDRPGEERPPVRHRLALRPIQLSKRDVLDALYRGRERVHDRGVEGLPAAQRRPRAGAADPARPGRAAAAHGPVRRAQLQHGRARAARHRQEPPVPAGLALRPPRLRRQGDRRADVREQRQRPARAGLPVRRRLLRRGLRRLLRPEGRRQHHEGLHGVRRVQPRARRASAPTAASSWSATSTSMSQHQQRVGHLFGPLPPEMRNDTAFMDRIHAYLPGWDVPEAQPRRCSPTTSVWSATSSPSAGASCATQSRLHGAAGPRALRRRAERPRHERGQQDGQRAAQAALSRTRRRRSPTRIWSGRCGWRWSAAGGSRSSRSGSARAEFRNTQFSYTHGRRRRRAVRRHARAAERGQHRRRSAAARPGLGDQPRRRRTRIPASTASKSPRARAAASAS